MGQEMRRKNSPYFDQDDPERPIVEQLASLDRSEPYGLYAAAVYSVEPSGHLVVYVSGCSCWPDRGNTTQVYCATRADLDREITEPWRDLLDQCQAKWSTETPAHPAARTDGPGTSPDLSS